MAITSHNQQWQQPTNHIQQQLWWELQQPTIEEQQDNIDKIVKNVTKAVTIDKTSIKALKH